MRGDREREEQAKLAYLREKLAAWEKQKAEATPPLPSSYPRSRGAVIPMPRKNPILDLERREERRGAAEQPVDLQAELSRRLFGQETAVEAIIPYVHMWRAGLAPEGRPAGVFMLLGGTGTGKSFTVEALAAVLHNDEKQVLRLDCGEFQHGHEIAKLLGCFVPGTAVLMADGSRKPIEDIRVGDSVLSRDGSSRKVEDCYTYQADGEIVELSIAGVPRPLRVTSGHEIWAIKGNGTQRSTTVFGRSKEFLYDPSKLAFIPAGDLQPGDVVVYPRMRVDSAKQLSVIDLAKYIPNGSRLKIQEDTIESGQTSVARFIRVSDLARIAGYYVAEGGVNSGKKGVNFTFGFAKATGEADLTKLLKKVFKTDSIRTETRQSSNRVYLYSRVVGEFFSLLFGSSPQTKRIPSWLLHAPDADIWNFLDAAFMGDGGRTVKRRLDYSTVSENLASQIEMLIRRLGFTSSMQIHEPPKAAPHWSRGYRIYVSGEQISRFVANLRLMKEIVDVSKTGRAFNGIQRQSFVDEDYVYFQITGADRVEYHGPVHDFSVAEKETYVLSFVAHNSPPGYMGHRETKPLLSKERLEKYRSPGCRLSLVLFDEIEKGARELQRLLLGILDKGQMTTGDGEVVSFEDTMIFMTSNVGVRELRGLLAPVLGLGAGEEVELDERKLAAVGAAAVKKTFAAEFINRIDAVVTYKPLDKLDLRAILEVQLMKIQRLLDTRLKDYAPEFFVSEAAAEWLTAKGFSKEYGARELKRVLLREIQQPIVGLITKGGVGGSEDVYFDLAAGGEGLVVRAGARKTV